MKKRSGRNEAATSLIEILLDHLPDFRRRRVHQNTSTTTFRIEALENRLLLSADLPTDLALGLAKSAMEPPAQLLVVDGSLQDRQSLLNALSGSEQLILDPERDGIEQITHALAGRSDIAGIQILSHGSSGSITLGSTTLNAGNLETYSSQLRAWAGALTADADILLYGCDVAVGEGVTFLDDLSRLTGADIAASTNPTGSAALGGDWNLEYETGAIESQTISEEMTGGASLLLGTVHVSTSGADSNTGGAADPFRTIGRAVVAAAASANGQDIIQVQAGLYNGAADQSISIPPSGNIDNLSIQGGFDPTFTTRVAGTTIYTPQNAGSVSAADVDVLDDGVTIDGIKFVFDGTLGSGGTRESGGILSRGKNLTLTGNTVEIGSGNASFDAFGLQTFFGSDQGTLTVTGNVFESNNSGAFHSGGIYLNPGVATGVLIDGNTVFGSNLFRGIADDSLSNVTISNNRLFRTGPAADFSFTPFIYAGAFNGSADQANVTISGNLINRTVDGGVLTPFDNTVGIEVGNSSGNGFAISGVTLTNNTVQNTTRGLLISAHADGLTVGGAAAGSGGSYTHNDVGIFAPGVADLTLRNVAANGNLSDGLRAFELTGTLNISDSSFSNNDADDFVEGDGIDLTNVQNVVFLRVTAIGNDPGVSILGAASFSDTDGVYTANDNHGIQLIDIAGNVTLIRTVADDNDADNNGVGDGINASTSVNPVAIGGNVLIQGARFRDSGAISHQERGVFIQSVAAVSTITFNNSTGVVQSTIVTGNEADGVVIGDGGSTATFTNGTYSNNGANGIELNAGAGSFSGSVTLTGVTANSNALDGVHAINLTGTTTITGGSYGAIGAGNSDDGLDLSGDTLAGTTLLVSALASGNSDAGLVARSFAAVSVTDGIFNRNSNHGIQLIDITGLVSLTRVTANDDDANSGGVGDGVNMIDSAADADTNAIGSLLVVGGSFSDTAALGAQRFGIRVGDGIGVGSVHSVAGSIAFQSDAAAGPLQNVSITGNQNSGVEIEDGGTTASITGNGNYSGNGAAGPNQGAGLTIASLSSTFTVGAGSTFSNNTSHGLSLASVGDVSLTGITANDNTGDGIRITGAGNVTTDTVTANGNDPGVFVDTALSYTDIAGIYTGNDTHGIQLIDIVGLVSLTRTTANDNDANNDFTGDGVNMTDGGDADTNAVGSLSVTGGSFSNTAAAGGQLFGIRVGDGIGVGAVHSVAGAVSFQSDSAAGPLQHVNVTGNQNSGVEIEDGGTSASVTGAGSYDGNINAGFSIASLSGGFTAADSTFSGNINHGIRLIDIAGLVSLTRVTANDNDANIGGIGDGVNMTDGPDAGTDAIGSLLVVGGSFNDTAAGSQRFGIRVGDGIGVGSVHSVAGSIVFQSDTAAGPLQNVSITGNQNSGVEIEDGGTTASITGNGNYSGNGAAGPNQGTGLTIASLSSTVTVGAGSTFSNNTSHGLSLASVGDVSLTGITANDNTGDGIRITGAGNVTTDTVTANGNDPGVFVDTALSYTDIAGIYTGNDTHGIQLIDIVGLVSLTRTTANDNDANNDFTGDGVNMTDGGDADTNAVGSLSVTGGIFSNTAAAGGQLFGIRVGDGIGVGSVHSIAGSIVFQSDAAAGPLQHVSVTGNQNSGVEIEDGGTSASVTGAGSYDGNINAGFSIASLSGGFTAADSTFSGNINHGIRLIDIAGLVSLTRVTANDNDANIGGIGDGVNMTDGPDAGTDAIGSLLVVGGSFNDTAAGSQRFGIRVGDGIGVGSVHSVAGSIVFQSDTVAGPLQHISITGNQNSGVEIEDGGTTASITGNGNYSGNGAAGPNQGTGLTIASLSSTVTVGAGSTFSNNTSQGLSLASVGDVNLTGITANDNTGDGIRITGAGNVTTDTVTANGNDPGVFVDTALSYTDIAGIYTGNDTHGIQLIDIVGLVSLTRTTANDNDANNDFTGDGVNMTDGGDADTNAVGSLSVTGGSFSNTAAAGGQLFGIRVGDGIGVGSVHSIAGSIVFQSDAAAGPLQHVSVTGNQNSGVEIEDGGTSASVTGAGSYDGNINAGFSIASLSGGFTAADSTFSGNINHGIRLIDIAGLVSLTRVTANDNDANIGGIGDGVNMTDGPDAGTDAIGSLLVVGGSFNDTAAGSQRFGIRVGDGIGVGSVHSVAGSIVFQSDTVAGPLQHISITGNQNSGVEIEDGGTTASISGNGNYSGNGASGPNQGAGFTIASLSSTFTLTGNLTASNNSGDGVNVSTSGTILIAGSLDTGTDPVVLTAPGGVTFDSSSVLYVDLGGTSAGAFTTITISHAVTLDGTLNAELVGGFSPVSGDRFRFMTFASRTGFFAATILPAEFVIDQSDATDLELVFNPNVAPVANNDTYTTDSNTPLNSAAPGVLANDTDADGDALTAILVTGPTHGTLIFHADGSFLYTPNSGFVGTETFTYRADDGTDPSGPASVTINVVPLSTIVGLVYEDANNNGHVDSGEQGIAGVSIHLTGTDYLGQSVNLTTTTDAGGVYTFTSLRRGTYSLAEAQPSGYTDGIDSVGTVNGVVTGNNSINDTFAGIVITSPGSSAANYNFGERADVGVLQADETAGIGFWRNNNGRALLASLNGGPNSTALGDWLASNFSNMWGANAGANNLAGKTNTQVADFYRILFEQSKTDLTQAGLGGPPKLDAQMMAVAFAVYVTDTNLAGTAATSYGFVVDASGTGARTFNVGINGAAFGIANGTQTRIFDLLLAADNRAFHGVLYDTDHDGDANSSLEVMFRTMANVVFSGINETGSI